MSDDDNIPYKLVEEPGILLRGNRKLVGVRRMLQPCDEDQNPIPGERIPVSFVPEHEFPRDRSRYEPHQGKQECARRARQMEKS